MNEPESLPPIDNSMRVITVRCPAVMHRRLMDLAHQQRRSMNVLCNELLAQAPRDSVSERGSAIQLAERLQSLLNKAVTCRRQNTDAWMQGLEEELNRAAAALGDADRAKYDGRDQFRIDRGDRRTDIGPDRSGRGED